MPLCPQMEILKSTIQDMEKERDFYFGKLRNIELICQEKEGEDDPTLNRIIDILYATDVSSSDYRSPRFKRVHPLLKVVPPSCIVSCCFWTRFL